jgi:hypothetical protein
LLALIGNLLPILVDLVSVAILQGGKHACR